MSRRTPGPDDRVVILTEERNAKMARSAHAYVRGNTLKFYEWLEATAAKSLPEGPAIWICGDCHIGNLGPVANAKGRIDIQIRDLDQTVIGNPAHDLIRLGLSLATAARGSDLPGVTTARMLEELMAGYQAALDDEAAEPAADKRPKAVRVVMRRARGRRWRHLAKERIADLRPEIPLGRRFWALEPNERAEIDALFAQEDLRRLATSLQSRDSDAEVRVADAAYWMKGCSSLGRLRYAALLHVGDGDAETGGLCLMDIKEALRPAAPRAPGVAMPRSNGERVVAGARALSPFLGERMAAARLLDRSVFVRELMPQDLKLEIDRLTRDEAVTAASYLARVVGKAHARQLSDDDRRAWRDELGRRWPKGLDAPFWLWTSVVELAATHESAYL